MQKAIHLYAIASTLTLAVIMLSGFQDNSSPRFSEITVERINVVDPFGRNRLVISNDSRMPGPMHRGEEIVPNPGRTGMLFYNEEGTEAGGLIFSGRREEDGVTATGSLTFDQYEQDQTVALQYVDDNGTWRAGLAIIDRPTEVSLADMLQLSEEVGRMDEGPERTAARVELRAATGRLRLYVGRSRNDGNSLVSLADSEGRARIRLWVTPEGEAAIEFLDAEGNVTRQLTGAE